ncbi:hypothetical protein FSP39_005721 [Pinctada imbricata]|uniref:Fucosyltransferase N-terminal domain-containing protein n=1 Tax=Pinctada imbricata TaxID=66713 RepID=A0AA88XRU8_PINIB|nr:hypothetical protein FSP39_005721 [Pinctada imbricata]
MNRRPIPTNRLPKLICFAALLFISVQILISHFTTDDDVLYFYGSGVNVSNHVIYFQSRDFRPKPKKLILVWTPMFFKWSLWSSAIEAVQNCKNNCSCEMTTDTRRLEEADAILFHCMDMMPWTGFPKYRNPSQIWVVWCAEPPTKIWSSLSGYRLLFNWTMYYRSDSTVFAPFARFRRLEKHEIKKENSIDFLKSKRLWSSTHQ